jgi:hypothetical protein
MRYAHHRLHTKAYYWGYESGPRFTTIFRLVNTAIVQHQRSYIKSPHTPKAATNQIPSQAPKAATHPPATLRHTSSRSCAHVSGDAGAWGLTAQLRPNYQGNQSNQKKSCAIVDALQPRSTRGHSSHSLTHTTRRSPISIEAWCNQSHLIT